MFNLEQSIADWRQQMQAAGIKTPVPLDELESHLREEIERRVKSGWDRQEAFAISIRQIGPPGIIKGEFKKIEDKTRKRLGLFAVLVGVVIILRILIEHLDAAHLRRNEQAGWIVTGATLVLFGLSTLVLVRSSDARELRRWKCIGIAYSAFGAWLALLPMAVMSFKVPGFGAAVGMNGWVLVFASVMTCFLAVPGWQLGSGILPAMKNRQARKTIGITGCLLGPVAMALAWPLFGPQFGHFPAPQFFVLIAWAWTLVAILGGVGYGLAEATRRQTITANS